MGNSALGGSLCNGMTFPCQFMLGWHVVIEVIKFKEYKFEVEVEDDEDWFESEVEDDEEDWFKSEVEDEEEDGFEGRDEDDEYENEDDRPNNSTRVIYTVGNWSKCELVFRISNNCNTTSFTLNDQNRIACLHRNFTIRKVGPNHLKTTYFEPNIDYSLGEREYKFTTTSDWSKSGSAFIKSSFTFYHTRGINRGLVVVEQKKKSKDENPFMTTVAHYYVTHDFNLNQLKIDIGLSVIVKIESLKNKGLHSTLEGPTQHSAAALIYMMDEVKRTEIWKPTTCPHCAVLQEQQSSRAKGSLCRRGINNDGPFNGDGNGNIIGRDFNQYTIYPNKNNKKNN